MLILMLILMLIFHDLDFIYRPIVISIDETNSNRQHSSGEKAYNLRKIHKEITNSSDNNFEELRIQNLDKHC